MPIHESPSDLVRAGLAAHVAGEWGALAALLDAASLDRWCQEFIIASTGGVAFEELRRELPGVRTVEELAQLSSVELLMRFLDASDPVTEMNRTVAAAYAAVGIERPSNTIQRRSARNFEIVNEKPRSKNKALVTFREEGAPDGVEKTWSVRRDRTGQWWLRMTSDVVHLPGVHIDYIDDPVVIAYLQRYSEQ